MHDRLYRNSDEFDAHFVQIVVEFMHYVQG